MPILLVFALTAACLPVEWPAPLFGGGARHRRRVRRVRPSGCRSSSRSRCAPGSSARSAAPRSARPRSPASTPAFRRLMFFVNVGLGRGVRPGRSAGAGSSGRRSSCPGSSTPTGEPLLAPFAELAVPLPYFLILFGCWTRLLRRRAGACTGRPRSARGPAVLVAGRVLLPPPPAVRAVGRCCRSMLFVTQQTLGAVRPGDDADRLVQARVAGDGPAADPVPAAAHQAAARVEVAAGGAGPRPAARRSPGGCTSAAPTSCCGRRTGRRRTR